MNNIISKKFKNAKFKAFALFEISILLIVLSVASYGFIKSINMMLRVDKENITKQRVERIYKALGVFINHHGYLPYPYMPSNDKNDVPGISSGEISDDEIVAHQNVYKDKNINNNVQKTILDKKSIGIVPYTTLGLNEKDVKDGNGNYFTYAMNPILGKRKDYLHLSHSDQRIKYDFDFDFPGGNNKYLNPHLAQSDDPHIKKICNFCSIRMYANDETVKKIVPPKCMVEEGVNYKRSIHPNLYYHASIPDLTGWVNSKLSLYSKGKELSHLQSYLVLMMHEDLAEERSEYVRYSLYKNYTELHNMDQFKVRDTIAVILVSHGRSGGHLTKFGQRYPINNSAKYSEAKQCNADDSRRFYMEDISDSNSQGGGFDDEVFYISKFHLASMYGAFVCKSYILWSSEYLGAPYDQEVADKYVPTEEDYEKYDPDEVANDMYSTRLSTQSTQRYIGGHRIFIRREKHIGYWLDEGWCSGGVRMLRDSLPYEKYYKPDCIDLYQSRAHDIRVEKKLNNNEPVFVKSAYYKGFLIPTWDVGGECGHEIRNNEIDIKNKDKIRLRAYKYIKYKGK